MVAANVAKIQQQIAEAVEKSGRAPQDVTLIGVTKTASVPAIRELIHAGVTNLGENRVQDFLPKYAELQPTSPTWHFIGHLQRNKVKQIIDKASLIHSVDTIELACEINKRAEQSNRTMEILIEINIANEPTKHGILAENANEFSKQIFGLSNVRLCGLMCVAPFVENAEKNRKFFAQMRDLSEKIFLKNRLDMKNTLPYTPRPFELSMGMSGDFLVAIEEGATMVRIGTALVGTQTFGR